jgi:hypothetical protein
MGWIPVSCAGTEFGTGGGTGGGTGRGCDRSCVSLSRRVSASGCSVSFFGDVGEVMVVRQPI